MPARHAYRLIFAGIAALAVASLASPAPAEETGSAAGIAKWDGPKPKRLPLQMKADAKCIAMHGNQEVLSEEELVGDAGEIQNVFVYVKAAPKGNYAMPAEPAEFDQKGCTYVPHVQGVRVGQKINIVSSDETMHNVRCIAKVNKSFNMAQPAPGTREKTFDKAEAPVKFKCDVHPWMTGYIFVMDHPFFATTDAKGAYEIKGLPPGDYTLVAWHEKYGKQESKITVAAGAKAASDFTFAPPQKK